MGEASNEGYSSGSGSFWAQLPLLRHTSDPPPRTMLRLTTTVVQIICQKRQNMQMLHLNITNDRNHFFKYLVLLPVVCHKTEMNQ